jgi:hypothetical protein
MSELVYFIGLVVQQTTKKNVITQSSIQFNIHTCTRLNNREQRDSYIVVYEILCASITALLQ